MPTGMPRAEAMTAMYRRGVEVRDIAERFGVQSPAVWRALRRTGELPPYKKLKTGRRAAGVCRESTSFQVLGERVSRDPCPRCGVRADIGCPCAPAALGLTVMA